MNMLAGRGSFYVSVVRAHTTGTALYVALAHFIAPVGTKVFAVLGEDRVLYVSPDSGLGREYAVRVVKRAGWNIELVRVGRLGHREARYTVPKRFAQYLGLGRGDYVLAAGTESTLEVVPLRAVLEKLGRFREPLL